MNGESWTIDELARRAAEVLASEGVRAPNGRVSAAPDRRVIRWYATTGLLDPPLRTRGRTARYGERHLLQLVAVKRRQAEGHPLAAIQAELAGATDATLRRVAALPASAIASATTEVGAAPADHPAGERRQFWRATPAVSLAATSSGPGPAGSEPGPGELFHAPVRVVDAYDRLLTPEHTTGPVAPVYPVALHPAATLTLSAPPTDDDLAAIHAAARPLLDLLADRGLLPTGRTA